jgi:hypothetical protein
MTIAKAIEEILKQTGVDLNRSPGQQGARVESKMVGFDQVYRLYIGDQLRATYNLDEIHDRVEKLQFFEGISTEPDLSFKGIAKFLRRRAADPKP